MRDYFMSLVHDLIAASIPEEGSPSRLSELREAARAGRPVMDDSGLLGMLATPAQRKLIDRMQALMSLLEGHGHVVMDRIGARELVTQERMSNVLKARRQDPRAAMFMRLVGLEMKLRQYELGAKFIAGVERHAGAVVEMVASGVRVRGSPPRRLASSDSKAIVCAFSSVTPNNRSVRGRPVALVSKRSTS